jgi:arabinan endo-1,5-alpha-L-arabinosidase
MGGDRGRRGGYGDAPLLAVVVALALALACDSSPDLGRDDGDGGTGDDAGVFAPEVAPYTNPVLATSCPDPGVLVVDSRDLPFVMVCTGGRMPVRRSKDLVTWETSLGAVLPDGKAPWASNGFRNWAPEIHKVGEKYIAYFTSVNGADVLSIGAASADFPNGPYTHQAGPLVEHPDGVIDASYFEGDDGRRYLLYKIDGNAHKRATPIFARELAPDGLSFAAGSAPVQLLTNDSSTWEGGVVEAPWVVKRGAYYFLFYSGNVYDHRYRTGVARSLSALGPYEKHGAPILANNDRWVGPGHGSIVTAGGEDFFVYHAWNATLIGTNDPGPGRHVLVDRITWENDWPRISDGTPSRTPQPGSAQRASDDDAVP